MKKEFPWRWIERGIWLLGLTYAIIQWRVDVGAMKGDLQTLKENDKKQDARWEKQIDTNGRFYVISALVLGGTATPIEEESESE